MSGCFAFNGSRSFIPTYIVENLVDSRAFIAFVKIYFIFFDDSSASPPSLGARCWQQKQFPKMHFSAIPNAMAHKLHQSIQLHSHSNHSLAFVTSRGCSNNVYWPWFARIGENSFYSEWHWRIAISPTAIWQTFLFFFLLLHRAIIRNTVLAMHPN